MTLQEWIESKESTPFDELVIVNRNGEELTSWIDDDPKYQAKVVDVKVGCNIVVAEVMIDLKGK